MMKNVIRATRWLAHNRINITPILVRQFSPSNILVSINTVSNHKFSSIPTNINNPDQIEHAVFEDICNETLESLCEYFEEVIDQTNHLKGADVTYSDGVLTLSLGPKYGTYVINRQTPNKQIWLSSPVSGPKRYDLVLENGGYWIYKHDGVPLHRLLQDELSKIVETIDFKSCTHSKV